ncbi:hypothetical protein VVD49_18150 [Uliginosibacterium sp. H3]|uniref:Glycosyltransferase family 9 (Heptosyltransferase) n=1 Tax=Uliginosibacterium silvisoli TaxID=3114758 RepID=A0ABU6K7H6_9RHOO|nr:hypothetical protein [Uliginosibacterium sp. H3]
MLDLAVTLRRSDFLGQKTTDFYGMKHIIGKFLWRSSKNNSVLPKEWLPALQGIHIEELRVLIENTAKDALPTLALLRDEAQSWGWNGGLLEKLCAYRELCGDEVEQGYRRVIREGLAERDFELMAKTASRCHDYRRYQEAWQIFSAFRFVDVPAGQESRYYGLSVALLVASKRDIREVRNYADKAMEQGYISTFFALNAIIIYFELGDLDKVRILCAYIANEAVKDSSVLQCLGWVELARGYYPEGFRLLEARMELPELKGEVPHRVWVRQRWDGRSMQGMRLLIYEEQGLGDTIMMARYFAGLIEKGVKVILAARQQVISLLESSFPQITYTPRSPQDYLDVEFDVWAPMMSLPYYLNTTIVNVPRKEGYLVGPRDQKSYWSDRIKNRFSLGKLRVGIAWSGNPDHKFDKRRSLTFDEIAEYVRLWPEIDFFALQTSTPDVHPANLHVMSEEFVTLSDTAALIELMDIVISVDTSVIHLAGALGKKSFLMLPCRYEWRWGLEGEANAWYDSVRVVRQSCHGDWTDVLHRIFGKENSVLATERPV